MDPNEAVLLLVLKEAKEVVGVRLRPFLCAWFCCVKAPLPLPLLRTTLLSCSMSSAWVSSDLVNSLVLLRVDLLPLLTPRPFVQAVFKICMTL